LFACHDVRYSTAQTNIYRATQRFVHRKSTVRSHSSESRV
jgi:hypothetical protein